MPRSKPDTPFDAEGIAPESVIDLGPITQHQDGGFSAVLCMPDIPAELVEEVSQACARAYLAVLKWPEERAAILAERVSANVAQHLQQGMAPPDHEPRPERPQPTPGQHDPDDDLPF